MEFVKCDICEDWGVNDPFYQVEHSISGILNTTDYSYHTPSVQAENNGLYDGIIAYRYFCNRADIDIIIGSQNIASFTKCICLDCINYSLSLIPHYGDGAYCTTNEGLKNSPPRIIHGHGIDIRSMNYRLILKIINVSKFRIINKAAGVTRSIPAGQELFFNHLVFADDKAIRILGFQKWNGRSWEDLTI